MCLRAVGADRGGLEADNEPREEIMEIVHVTEADELTPEDQRFCEATKAWFKIDFVPKMSRVLLTLQIGRASCRERV